MAGLLARPRMLFIAVNNCLTCGESEVALISMHGVLGFPLKAYPMR